MFQIPGRRADSVRIGRYTNFLDTTCHAHSGDARTAREKLATMPTDADIDFLFSVYSASPSRDDGGPEWGDRVVWEDLHHRDPYPFWLD